MTIFISILIKLNPNTLYIGRAIFNLIILARYRSYNNNTIRYLLTALARINLLKEVFRAYRPLNKTTDKGHFNFPKFHSISHLPEIIRLFDLPDKLITQVRKKTHIEFFKNYYAQTNKHNNYIKQIIYHDIVHVISLSIKI